MVRVKRRDLIWQVTQYIIAKMQEKYPAIQPMVRIGNTEEIVGYMMRHQLDVGIIEGNFQKEHQMHVKDFAKDSMVVVASPQHRLVIKGELIQMVELGQERWVLREVEPGTREAAETVFERHEMIPNHIISFGSTQAIKEAVKAGLGISLLSRWAIQRELQSGELKIIDVDGLPFTREFSIVTTSPFQTKAQQVFIQLLHCSEEITNLHCNNN